MLSFQELKEKTQGSLKPIQECLDKGFFHPDAANIYTGLKQVDAYEVQQTLNNMTLTEVLINAQTAGGTGNIVATKVHDTLFYAAKQYDICPLIGYVTNGWQGGAVSVNIAKDGTFKPKRFSSSAKVPEQEPQFVRPQLTADKLEPYGMNMAIGKDLLDDQQYGLVEWLVTQAGKSCGELATDLALSVLLTATDGDGTLNSGAAAAAETTSANIMTALRGNASDRFISNTLLCTQEAWAHSIAYGAEVAQARYWIHPVGIMGSPVAEGFHTKWGGILDVLINNSVNLHASGDVEGAAMTGCITLIFDRNNAILTGRKRWLELKNYSNPIEDLSNAVVSFRQDSVTLYNDCIYKLTEA